MRNTFGRRRLGAFMGAALTVALTFVLGAAALANPHYDDGATSGGLHKVCTDFSFVELFRDNAAPNFHADCNKEVSDTGQIEVVSASIALADGIGRSSGTNLQFETGDGHDRSCEDWEHQSRSDGVYIRASCGMGRQYKWTTWLNLNDGIEWNEVSGVLEWK